MTALGKLELELHQCLQRHGSLGFDQWMEAALYHRQYGFFATGGEAGKRGKDFLTSPEVGPLFGAVLANAIDGCWQSLGCPDPFVVAEAGAGAGTLAASVLRAEPQCLAALRYVLVERSAALRARHAPLLGEQVSSLAELPAVPLGAGMIIANELLDNLAFQILEFTSEGWQEVVCVASGDTVAEARRPIASTHQQLASQLAPQAAVGDRIPWQCQAAQWVTQARDLLTAGEVLVFDYGGTTAELAQRGGWLRTYCQHQHGGHPLELPGQQDITADVAFDQLPPPDLLQTQAQFLQRWGIDELVAEGQAVWREQAAQPTTETLLAGSRMAEAATLCDPDTYGSYQVASWGVPATQSAAAAPHE